MSKKQVIDMWVMRLVTTAIYLNLTETHVLEEYRMKW